MFEDWSMQQTCVSISTSKTLNEAEQIAKNMGMEIVLKTTSAWLEFEDLSESEMVAWYDATAEQMKQLLADVEKSEKVMQEARLRSTN